MLKARFGRFYNELYRGATCCYCGDRAETLDHIPPLDVVYHKGLDYFEIRGIQLVTVSACKNCNSILGSKAIYTVQHRVLELYKVMLKKHEKLLKMPDWSEKDLYELKGNLRRMVRNHVKAKKFLERRLAFMEDQGIGMS